MQIHPSSIDYGCSINNSVLLDEQILSPEGIAGRIMTERIERTRLISYLLYGPFSAEKKGNVFQYPLARKRSFEDMFTEPKRTRPYDRNQKNFSLVIDKIVNFSRYFLFSPSRS